MPTLSQMKLPIPSSWDEFEEITLDALKTQWNSDALQRHGRQGQAQQGVDIYGYNDMNDFVGVQCKKYEIQLTTKNIKQEIDKAEKFEPVLAKFYFATTTPRDAKIQKEVRLLSKERTMQKKFPVGIFFWEDIKQGLSLNPQCFRKHYPQLFGENRKINNMAGLLDLAFYGLSFKFYMSLIFGEIGIISNADPLEMQAVCELIDSASFFINNSTSRNKFRYYISQFREYVFSSKSPDGWQPAVDLGTNIETIILGLESNLETEELVIYKLGMLLSNWDKSVNQDKTVSNISIERFNTLLGKLNINNDCNKEIDNMIEHELNDLKSICTVTVPSRIYNLIREELIMKSI